MTIYYVLRSTATLLLYRLVLKFLAKHFIWSLFEQLNSTGMEFPYLHTAACNVICD